MLPTEILETIATYLTERSLHVCMRVCRDWYSVFQTVAYKTVDTRNGRKLETFLRKIPNVGPSVQELVITNKSLQVAADIIPYCPGICRLRLCIVEVAEPLEKQLADIHNVLKNMRLKQLELQQYSISSNYLDLKDILSVTSTLCSLSLTGVMPSTLIDCLDTIHQNCPHLQQLRIQLDRELLHDFLDRSHQQMHMGIVSGTLERSKTPLRELSIDAIRMHFEYCDIWLRYFALRYPDLRVLRIVSSPEYSFAHQHQGRIRHDKQIPPCALLANNCTRLERLEIQNFYLPGETLSALASSARTVRLDTNDYINQSPKIDDFEAMFHRLGDKMEELWVKISDFQRRSSQSLRGPATPYLPLRQLTIVNCPEVVFDSLLEQFPNLCYLSLTSGRISHGTSAAVKDHPLQTLHLYGVEWEDPLIFSVIANCCPSLEHLGLHQTKCKVIISHFVVAMPTHYLKSLRICYPMGWEPTESMGLQTSNTATHQTRELLLQPSLTNHNGRCSESRLLHKCSFPVYDQVEGEILDSINRISISAASIKYLTVNGADVNFS